MTSATGTAYSSVVVEADGGSRGNPGPAAYGAVLKDAVTGEVVAERGERIGFATNNVAEYRGLIAGLELYAAYADGAALEVRMDSKLVVEQMAGRWKIKHPDMKPLAAEASALAPAGTTWTWVPRAQNAHADRLANQALDGPEGVVVGFTPDDSSVDAGSSGAGSAVAPGSSGAGAAEPAPRVVPPWEQGPPTVLVLVRHGETEHTTARVFSGSTGADPDLTDAGREQVRETAAWLAPLLTEEQPVVLTSPMRRTRQSCDLVLEALGGGREPVVDDGFLEAGFGTWEGLTYGEVLERDPEAFTAWIGDPSRRPGGTGESMTEVAERMARVRDRVVAEHEGRVVVAVTHLTPIAMLVSGVLGVEIGAMFHYEVQPASVTVLAWYPDGRGVLRLLNGRPTGPHLH